MSIIPAFGDDTNWEKMDIIVKEKVQTGDSKIDVIIEFEELNDDARMIVIEMGQSIISEFESINSIATNLSSEQIKTISKNSLVMHIYSVNKGQYFGFMANDTINTATVKNMGNYNGKGVTIVVIDSGIRTTHQEFSNTNILYTWDFVNNNSDVTDDTVGHGTGVASCIFGNYFTTESWLQAYPTDIIPATGSNTLGVAPSANLIFLQNLSGGVPDTIASLNAMEWCIANKTKYNIRVVNMSFGLGSIPNGNSPETKLADKMVDAGIVVVVSAGNAGPGSGTIGTPGDAKNAITVGAVQDRTTIGAWQFSKASPSMAVFSSRGPTSDGRAKPDVVAPGVSVIVARFGSDTQYEYTNGTSYSSPYTAGACALIIQRHPNWHPVHVKQALIATASPVSGAGQYDQGAGLINIYRAINYRQPFEGLPIAQILKIVKGNQNKE